MYEIATYIPSTPFCRDLRYCYIYSLLSIIVISVFMQSVNAKAQNRWKKVERYGRLAFYFTMATWGYVEAVAVLIVDLIIARDNELYS